MGKVKRIDFSAKRLSNLAQKYLSEGKYSSALRFTYRELNRYGDNVDLYFRLADIYDEMGLNSSAINCWYKALDNANEEDYPDIFEGLAANYLNMGKDAQAAFYYNCLLDVDDDIPDEMRFEIAEAFSEKPQRKLKISYPPKLADYSKEMGVAARALKRGDCKNALSNLEKIEKGSTDYVEAAEMRALAFLLSGNVEKSKAVCFEILEEDGYNVRALATLAAAYLEEGETEKSKELALRLCETSPKDDEERYKIATVCCENGLHEQAYERFSELEKNSPYDGRMLYFKGVAAFNSGKINAAINAFDELCAVYPDAAVVEYYLREMRKYKQAVSLDEEIEKPTLTYFYQLPQEEREQRCRFLMDIGKSSKEEAELLGLFANSVGLFRWCFDELDGMDHDLQYLACMVANRARLDDFLCEILLDNEVLDLLKIEILRVLYERNEERKVGAVIYHVYRKVQVLPIKIGRKSRKNFIAAYARAASKFAPINPSYGPKLKETAESLYRALEKYDCFDQAKNPDDCACAMYVLAGFKEMGEVEKASVAFDANPARVKVLLTTALSASKNLT